MNWNDVRYFLALARHGAVRAAAAELGVSHSTVARRVEALEEALATRLFDRHRDGYQLTGAGERLVPRAERVERDLFAMERDLLGLDDRMAGPVELTLCDAYVARVLMPELTAWCAESPGTELRMTADSRLFDLSKREADLAVRALALGAQPPQHLIGTKLAPILMDGFVATEHAERLDPEDPGSDARYLGFDDGPVQRFVIEQSAYPDLPTWGALRTIELVVLGALAGLGIVTLPVYVGDQVEGLQRLHRPSPNHLADLWLISHPDLRTTTRLRAARSCVIATFRANADLFEGNRPRRTP